MLFGITLIGTEFPKSRTNPWTALVAVLFFAFIVALFWNNHSLLIAHNSVIVENKKLFADSYSDFVIIFALIGTSLLYATIKMMKVLKPKRKKDV
jgi:NADH:ubiquinone oxidoreductase subunit 6 (subunit J)